MKTFAYLDQLPLTNDQKVKITAQDYDTPAILLGVLRAAPGPAAAWLGCDNIENLIACVAKLVPDDQAETKPREPLSFGVILPTEPVPPAQVPPLPKLPPLTRKSPAELPSVPSMGQPAQDGGICSLVIAFLAIFGLLMFLAEGCSR